MIDIKNVRSNFPIFLNNEDLVYLDSAASSLKHKNSIRDVMNYYMQSGSNVGRGSYKIQLNTSEMYEESRKYISRYLNAESEKSIVFTKGATHAFNMIAYHFGNKLKKGDEVLTTKLEHHASFLPWQRACNKAGAKLIFSPLDNDFRINIDKLLDLINEKTKVVAITLVSNVLGYVTPMEKIIKKAHDVGAIVVCDAAQAAPHQKLDVKELDCDFLAFSGHKCFGPTGVGVLYGKYEHLIEMEPIEVGGSMVDDVKERYFTTAEPPNKFEAGTPPIAQVIGLKSAIEYLNQVQGKKLEDHINELRNYAVNRLLELKDIIIYNPRAEVGIITFNLKDIHAHDVETFLASDNVCVRAGHHCARLLMDVFKTSATIRISLHIYNEKKDIDKLIFALKKASNFFNTLEEVKWKICTDK